jgi:hypothetical protein
MQSRDVRYTVHVKKRVYNLNGVSMFYNVAKIVISVTCKIIQRTIDNTVQRAQRLVSHEWCLQALLGYGC